jgi:hypothetical protein
MAIVTVKYCHSKPKYLDKILVVFYISRKSSTNMAHICDIFQEILQIKQYQHNQTNLMGSKTQ